MVATSAVLHAGIVAALLWFRSGPPVPDAPEKPAEVQLVMVEHAGDPSPPVQSPPVARAAETPPVQSPPVARAAETPPPPLKPRAPVVPPDEARETVPEQTQAPAVASVSPPPERPPTETVPKPPEAPKISLRGTDSPVDAVAMGNRIIPAAPDAVFHNRPPDYPPEAARRGERGVVIVVIHVSPGGRADAVEVVRGSGYASLDRAVREAVLTWRFLPAVRDGTPVATEMPMQFVFDNN